MMSSIGKKGGIQNFIFKKGIYVANFLRLINIFLFVIDLRKMKNTFLDVFQEEQLKRICLQCELKQGQIEKLIQIPIVDKMLGSFFGSLIGDCLAAYLKDQETKISEEKMKLLMKMPGGGDNKNLAGQFSDYSEMTVQLTSSLLIYDKEVSLKSQIASITTLIAFGHLIWLKTQPKNPDDTNQCGVKNLMFTIEDKTDKEQLKRQLQKNYEELNIQAKNTENNASLVRIVPLVIFLSLIKKYKPEEELYCLNIIKNQIGLTHAHKKAEEIGLQWVQLLSNLILRENALEDLDQIYKNFMNGNKSAGWKKQSQEEKLNLPATFNKNWIKIIYVHSLNKFKEIVEICEYASELNETLYSKYMKKIINLGGNQTANGCIFGGLLGSIVGFKELPKDYVQKLMKVKFQKNTQKIRPACFQPINGFINIIKLISPFMRQV